MTFGVKSKTYFFFFRGSYFCIVLHECGELFYALRNKWPLVFCSRSTVDHDLDDAVVLRHNCVLVSHQPTDFDACNMRESLVSSSTQMQ